MRAWFTEHPLYDAEGQPIVVPEWQFPARGRVKKQLQRAKTMAEKAERVLQSLPLRGKQAAWAAKLDETKTDIDRAFQYVQLYGLYTECEAIYQVDQLMNIHAMLDAGDQADFNVDPRSVDWPTYISTIHLPSIVHHSRAKTKPGRSRSDRTDRLRRSVLSPDRHIAAFDLENTLIASNVVESYTWLATRRLNTPERIRYVLRTLAEAPSLSAMDRKDRGDFLRFFYRRYEDAPVSQIDEDSHELLTNLILTKSFPRGIRRVREHKALGHRTVLITGALEFAVRGLHPLFDEIIAAEMTDQARRHLQRSSVAGTAHRRDPGPDPGRLLRCGEPAARGLGRLRRLDQRSADARGRRLSGCGEPRDQAGGNRPQARLAGRELVQGRRRTAAAAADRPAAQ